MHVAVRKTAWILLAFVVAALLVVGFNYARHYTYISLIAEPVAIPSGDVTLAGALLKPAEEGVYPAVIILHGSGPETRAELVQHVHANALVRAGFAVLVYDKRGTGDSTGSFDDALYFDFINDAIAAVEFLASRDDIDATRIGLQGNSESGWFTPEIAYRSGKVAFIFNRVSPPLSWVDNVLWEARNDFIADGLAESDAEKLLDITRRRWAFYIDVGRDPSLFDSARRTALNTELTQLRESIPGAADVLPEEVAAYDEDFYTSFASNASYDPRPFLELIDIPMIYAFGSTDINIDTPRSVAFLETFAEQYEKPIEFHVFEGVGHPMFTWRGIFNAGYVPGYLNLVSSWCREKAGME